MRIQLGNETWSGSVSIWAGSQTPRTQTSDQLIKKANEAVHRAKAAAGIELVCLALSGHAGMTDSATAQLEAVDRRFESSFVGPDIE
ncbi:MAG: hypothetical protein RQ741_06965 [Wenzhouxiangellaceae bacterium]|nr:hypothetical protein [Wenzhouxiangellaceae bacterium]